MLCPKCHKQVGGFWTQCEGVCPMPDSPHYDVGWARASPVGDLTFNPDSITPEQWRQTGYTPAARRYPLSDEAVRILAWMNRLPFDKVPVTWHFAPNEAVQQQMEALTKSPIMAVVKGVA